MKRAEQFLGVSLVSEKEIILIVTKTEQKNAIMKSIMEKAGIGTKAGTIAFSSGYQHSRTSDYRGFWRE